MTNADDLVPWLRRRELTVFVGAGASVVPPSCLPSWWQLNHALLDALADVGKPALRTAARVVSDVKQKQQAGRMPPEYTSEVIADLLGGDFFEVLRCLEGERTNLVHRRLAALGKARRLPAIVTTNFDTLIERAFADAGAPLTVLIRPEQYEGVDWSAHLEDPNAATVLLKLHGTATEPDTTIDTLAQRKRGLAAPIGDALRALLEHTRWCVLGYSGADLDAEPNYLYLRQMAARPTPGIDWLFRPTSTPVTAVHSVLDAYGSERATLHRGELPGWLAPLDAALEGTGVAPPEADPVVEVDALRASGAERLTAAARRWADELGPGACGLVLVNLAEQLHPRLADQAGQDVLEWLSVHRAGSRHHGIALMYAARHLQRASRSEQAASRFAEAAELFRSIGAADAYADTLGDYANVLAHVGRLDDAADAYRQSIELTESFDDPENTVIATINLADVLAHQGLVDEALDLAQGAVARAVTQGDETTRALALEHAARVLRDTGDREAALLQLTDAEAVRRRLGQDTELAYNLTHQATIHTHSADFDRASVVLAEAHALAERVGHLAVRATVRMTQAGVASVRGDYPLAVRLLREAGGLRQQSGDPIGGLEVQANLVGMMAAQGDASSAIAEGESALALAEQLGLPSQAAEVGGNLGLAYEMAGDLDAAVRHYERSREAAEQVDNMSTLANVSGNLGNVHYRRGDLDAAAEAYAKALELARSLGEPAIVVRTLANLGNIRQAQGRPEEASDHYSESLALAAEHGLQGITAHVHLNLGFARMGREEWGAAAADLARAQRVFETQGDLANAGLAALCGGQCLAQLGRVEEARTDVARALEYWAGLGHEREAEARTWLTHLGG